MKRNANHRSFLFLPLRILFFSALIALLSSLAILPGKKTAPDFTDDDTRCSTNYPASSTHEAAFFDLINGGTCWSCRKGAIRPITTEAITSSKACLGYSAATKTGNYGCVRKYGAGVFRDPIDGGTCYSCPSGYYRTLDHVNSRTACAKGIAGPFSYSTKHGTDRCDSGFGDAIEGGTCWTCPAGMARTILHAVNTDKACEGSTSALYRGKHVGLKGISDAVKQKIKTVSSDFARKCEPVMQQLKNIYTNVNGSLKPYLQGDALKNAVRDGTTANIWNQIKTTLTPLINQVVSLQNSSAFANIKNFKVLSISVNASGSVFLGACTSNGILIDFSNPAAISVKGFTETGAIISTSVSAGAGIMVQLLKKPVECGANFSVSAGFDVGFGSFGGNISIDPKLPCSGNMESLVNLDAILGIGISLSAGVSIPLPDIAATFSSMVAYTGSGSSCSPCGAAGQRPCGLTERIPSCNAGLTENCGVCN